MIRFWTYHLLVILAGLVAAAAQGEEPFSGLDDLIVTAIDSAQVPAMETGMICDVVVREGDSVKVSDLLARLDDRQATIERQIAATQVTIADENSRDKTEVALAEKASTRQQQLAKQRQIELDIAVQNAKNNLRVLAASKFESVAKNELQRAVDARNKYVDSVSGSEIESLTLAYERSKLETQQARFEQQVGALNARAEQQAVAVQKIAIDESIVAVDQAEYKQRVDRLQAELHSHRKSLAELTVSRHQILAPFDGVVVEVMRRKGEWVKAGDPVARVVRLDRLRAEGYVDAMFRNRLLNKKVLRLSLSGEAGENASFRGTDLFVSPEIDPVNNQIRFWVEFDNPGQQVLPGMRMKMIAGGS
ncbi:macrolide transporter subunit MacA [Planctomycetes bacterium CA13]|uniref:Macrolide transporter subunit MacA n=1 Tax=Novipirellula herctigrandis TaxID=2527986 RepID=A0A5C5YZ44_9BACT|nr:macrolide transporter subunit MacA [Planctomycetes bacterium CA13]